jgi:hypothetical protein
MVSIGNTTLPGVQTNVESANSTGVNFGAPGQVALVGEADLASGTATANEVEEIRTPVKARTLFGPGSQLAENVVAALAEGAYPVYAVATEEIDITGEDISGLSSTSGTLANAPVSEDPADMDFSVDSTTKTAIKTLRDPSTMNPATDEVYYNPSSGDFELDTAPASTGAVNYPTFDYDSAVEAMMEAEGEKVDIVGIINENADAVSYAHAQALISVNLYEFMVVVAGASPYIADTSTFTNGFDSSRIQLLYPGRDNDEQSLIGAYVGLRAKLGIDSSPMFKRLKTVNDLPVTLSKGEQTDLVNEKIVPLADESKGARIVEDLTTVADDNADEASMQQVLHRLIVDYVTEIVHDNSERYIGELHTRSARNSLQANITAALTRLMDLNSITAFTITVEKIDAMQASVDVGIDTVDPLRNILATISAGQIEGEQ